MPDEKRIAMWSGPRNLSTAMMRAFENRSDCRVCDEPFYAAYLQKTGLVHPMGKQIIEHGTTDPDAVIRFCTEQPSHETPQSPEKPYPLGKQRLFYQKHMTHHMLPSFSRRWLDQVQNLFLIRSPERVLASYDKIRRAPGLNEIGFRQQAEIFDGVATQTGSVPVVIEAEDIRNRPEAAMKALCAAVSVPFEPAMLAWPAGLRETDGIWAAHWYRSVAASTGFAPLPDRQAAVRLSPALRKVADRARPYYEQLKAHKLVF